MVINFVDKDLDLDLDLDLVLIGKHKLAKITSVYFVLLILRKNINIKTNWKLFIEDIYFNKSFSLAFLAIPSPCALSGRCIATYCYVTKYLFRDFNGCFQLFIIRGPICI